MVSVPFGPPSHVLRPTKDREIRYWCTGCAYIVTFPREPSRVTLQLAQDTHRRTPRP